MPPETEKGLPFLTRKMLDFEHGAAFSLIIDIIALTNVSMSLRGTTKAGPFSFTFIPAGNTTIETFTFGIPDIPIFLSLSYRFAADTPGFVQAAIHLGINGTRFLLLSQGSPSGMGGITWPIQNLPTHFEQNGVWTRLVGSDPAAGAEISTGVTTREGWKLHAVEFTFVTDATVATRHVVLQIVVANASIKIPASVSQVASLTKKYVFIVGAESLNDVENNIIVTALPPDLFLDSSNAITTLTAAKVVGDNFGAPTYIFRKFLRPA